MKSNDEKKMNELKVCDEILPQKVLFNLKLIEDIGIAKVSMMKKLIANGEIQIVKIGNKIHVTRIELIRFINDNTIDIAS